jgi:hypothetical protein
VTNVRKPCTKQIKVTNTSIPLGGGGAGSAGGTSSGEAAGGGNAWVLKPQFSSETWSGVPLTLQIKPQETVNYDITYYPTTMTKGVVATSDLSQPQQGLDRGTLFIPFPNGTAKLYQLEGIAESPVAEAEVIKDIQSKVLLTEKIVVSNWLRTPQRFRVSRNFMTTLAASTAIITSTTTTTGTTAASHHHPSPATSVSGASPVLSTAPAATTSTSDVVFKGLDDIDVPAQVNSKHTYFIIMPMPTMIAK